MILRLRAKLDRQDVTVAGWADASAVFRAWIEKNGYGASNLARGAGDIIDMGKKVAHVSYNGRVWAANGNEIV
jgi:hypothetical protein